MLFTGNSRYSVSQKVFFHVFLLFLCLTILDFNLYPLKIRNRAEKIIKKIIPGNISISHQHFRIPLERKKNISQKIKPQFLKDFVDLWTITENNLIKAYAWMDEENGKSSRFTFLVIFDDKATIMAIRILKYRGEYGQEIKNKNWLKQFKNKDMTSSDFSDHDIDSISGATISSQSLIKGVERLSRLMTYFIKNDANLESEYNLKLEK